MQPQKAIKWLTGLLIGLFVFPMNVIGLLMDFIQKRIGVRRMAYIFVFPNLLFLITFYILPIFMNFYYAITGGAKPLPKDRFFVGADNFAILLQCSSYLDPGSCRADLFWRGLYNTVGYVLFEVGGILLFSLVTALILNQHIKGRGFFRSVFFYPTLLSSVVVALLWKWVLQREGILNAGLIELGLEPINFLLSVAWSRFWVIFIGIWVNGGFYTLIVLAGLQAIPGSLYEAAKIDGAGPWADFRYITLPLLKPSLVVVFVLSFIRSVQVFDHVFVMTGGGPGTATQYIVQYIYNTGFSSQPQNLGLAAAASLILGLLLLVLTFIQLRVTGNGEEENYA
ncbi:MAG: sugar ABC transporter permease [Anaerolineales bacterium]|nr:sugar ABC transporter permease [Anaerolineales bacterium]